jgi:pimeloyl-ACP methyl ester carboxylesterase
MPQVEELFTQHTNMDHILNTTSGTLSYSDDGSESKEAVLFVNGFPLNKNSWFEQVKILAPFYRIITFDLTGLGKSTSDNGFVTIDSHVDDIITILNHCKIASASIVGLSMGGYIALRAADRYPLRFNALVLANTRADADSNSAKEKRFSQVTALKNGGILQFAETISSALFSDAFKKNHPEKVLKLNKSIQAQTVKGLCGNLMAIAARQDANEYLGKIKLPVLIISSDNDTVIPYEESAKIKINVTHAKITKIANSGHLTNIEQPDFFSKCIIEFLAKA